MIKIDYSNHEIKVEIDNISEIFETPLKLNVLSKVSGRTIWSSELNDYWWASFPNNEMNDVEVLDRNQSSIVKKSWDVIENGSFLYKTLYLYCIQKLNQSKRPKGLVVGTHDGEFGEWVPCILDNLSDAILVESSQNQFNSLKTNYERFHNVKIMNYLVTTDGRDVEFFEGGKGYTNSVVERVIKSWETEEIKSTIKNSVSINEIITEPIDWLHTDVEGYDSELIMGIEIEKLPNLIIFEHENLKPEQNEDLKKYLINLGYSLNYQKVSCLAIKK